MARQDFVNQEFEYFNIKVFPGDKKEIIDLMDDTVAVVQGRRIQFNQLDSLAKSSYDYQQVYLDKQMILDLADYLRSQEG